MTPSIRRKLEALAERKVEVERLLAESEVLANQKRFRELSREYAQLEPIADRLGAMDMNAKAINSAKQMQSEDDAELRAMATEELQSLEAERQHLDESLGLLLVPRDPRDDAPVFLEIRAGTGGDEAAIFAGDLYRMYMRYAESKRWHVELISANAGEHGGFKEVIARVEGEGAFARLKFESGTHRVQRVPETEAQGRIHTSAATVAVLPEVDDIEEIELNPADLRIDTFRASGAGGQHVNKTDSAIRVTHLPSGIVVECQDERSQHKNRARALSLLKARLLDEQQQKQHAAQAELRRVQVGSGDRSQRIRTYNFPQGRLTDHRIGLTLYSLDAIVEGELDPVIDALSREHQADELKLITEAA
ncbi:MAG TPA: peptide chain release factor 1 [Pseudomonadota bacterium]|nr:peptide chain release factor 1 [Xanthomonadales bacterium]HQW82163.1 peptide chain release factor 1 [Pseudomonadota bacterium]